MKVVDIFSKITILYLIHFGKKKPDLATCKDCVDFHLGLCFGGSYNVLDCMADKADKSEFFSNI